MDSLRSWHLTAHPGGASTPSFGGRVVAEGAETREGLAVLEELRVQLGQGFLFQRPAPTGELLRRGFSPRPAVAG